MVPRSIIHRLFTLGFLLSAVPGADGREPDRVVDLWPAMAPGESARSVGEALPRRPNENPPATRITGITRPQLEIYAPHSAKPNGTAVVILPGGGFNYVVSDKEGSEAADWLNRLGITGLVLRYRTKRESDHRPWIRPMQDGQRAVSMVRFRAADWGLRPNRIGVLGFSAGGQVAALIATGFERRSYDGQDAIDGMSCRPDFAMLIYPWQLVDPKRGRLREDVRVTENTPPTFLVHAHDDRSSSLSSVLFYSGLKQADVPAELHIYESGGHGYGLRPVEGSRIHTWPQRAEEWLKARDLSE